MMPLKLNTLGKIVKGSSLGWYVLIEPIQDEKTKLETGHYYLFIANQPDFYTKNTADTEVYDYWLEGLEQVAGQMEYFGWEIEWL